MIFIILYYFNMENTKNEMPPYSKKFFTSLKQYLDTKLYFYGSIQRNDYLPKHSDIDVDIFTDNEASTIIKLQNFLGVKRYEFKKFVYRLHKTTMVVYGYKVKYEEPENNFSAEISIYNEKNKEHILTEHNSKNSFPFYISILLIFFKTLYYKFNILSKDTYSYIKKILMNYMIEGKDVEFITTELPKDKGIN